MGAILSCSKNNSSIVEAKGSSPAFPEADDIEFDEIVCNEQDLPEQGMKSFPLGEGRVLVVRHKGKVTAVGNKCTHYGAPLAKGVLGEDGTVRCPWHGACFNTTTGDIEDFPGLDSLPCYSVTLEPSEEGQEAIEGHRQVRVKARLSQLVNNKREKNLARRDENNNTTIVVVGGGGAGSSCVEGLRQEGFTGRVVLVCGEQHLPYDRPKLSKNLSATAGSIALRTPEYYQCGDIEVVLSNPVLSLNSDDSKVLLNDGQSLSYDKLFIATGGSPRTLSCPGAELEGVLVLRSPDDAAAVLERARGQHVVVVGSSFIGMEAASHLAMLGVCASISVVGSGSVAYERSLGAAVGGRLQQLVQEQGVAFYMRDGVAEIQGNQQVEQVVLRSGTVLAAGLVLCGVGVVPATQFLEGSSLQLDDKGYVLVDQYLQTSVPNVYCGGDIASFPLRFGGTIQQDRVSIGHWQVAQYHGRTASRNLLASEDDRLAVNSVPFFWTVLMGKCLRYSGYGGNFDDVIISGDLAGLSFIAYYLRGENVVALASLGQDPAAANFAELLRAGKTITKAEVEEDGQVALKR
uniref:Apoptosis-inducing factor 3-like n=1 Tax=Hirondellea gigas TaxID=1518452 RepID=A0A6A7FPS8_9CRUS